MDRPDHDVEAQDQAEIYDETHLDDEGEGDVSLDEADDVLDVTQVDGDADSEAFNEDDADLEGDLALEGIEAEADALLGVDSVRLSEADSSGQVDSAPDEVELVYAGLMRNQRGAQASAAHWEAKRLSDDDIEDLGYGPDTEGASMTEHHPTKAQEDADTNTPPAKPAPREAGKPDQLKDKAREAENRQEALIDEGVEETFPASDPVAAKRIT